MHLPDPDQAGLFHIVGIGGIGMSAIAEVMHTRGYQVQGSDLKDSANLERLRARGITCLIGHDPANLNGAGHLVISSAVKAGNPEFEAAKERGLPIIRRAEMLAELMRPCATVSITGTHGKTTTTSLIADLLKAADLDPTVIAGGIINAWGTNARIGKGEWMVVEADESDGTFLKLPTQIGVVTNIDPEHMDYWPSLDALHQAFHQFIDAIPFYGLAVACIDHPVVRELLAKLGGAANGRRTLTYGVARDADIRLANLRPDHNRITFDADLGPAVKGGARKLEDLTLPVLGHYNALNALGALAAATEAGVSDEVIRATFAAFSGVKRRFSRAGEWQGVVVYDDYAHHPVEIAAVLRAARMAGKGRIVAVVQPHRYTRLQSLFNEFSACLDDADIVVVTPIYSAGEAPIPGIDRDELASGLRRHGHPHVLTVDDEQGLVETIASVAKPGDLVVGSRRRHHHRLDERPAEKSRTEGTGLNGAALESRLVASLPELRGRLKAEAPLKDLTWFRAGGPAEVLYSPADEADLAYFLRRHAVRHSRHHHRARLEPARARRRHRGRGDPARPRLRRDQDRGRLEAPRRHRRSRREGGPRRGRCRHRRSLLLSRHSGLRRRRAAHEWRSAWPRDERGAGRGPCRRPPGQHPCAARR